MKYLTLAMTIFVFISCGRENTRAPSSSLGTEMQLVSNLAGFQKQRAINLCFELKNKNIIWRNNLLNSNFKFSVVEKECGKFEEPVRIVTTTLKGPINAEAMRFDPPAGQILPYYLVETDVHGVLANLCTDILKGQNVSNTFSTVDGTAQISFRDDGFTLQYYKNGETTSYREVVKDFELDTSKLPSTAHKGLEKSTRMRETCVNGGTASITQTYQP